VRVARITLRNWLTFRGTHSVDLGPGVYGVVARLEADAGRSNWLGKSSFLAATRFALYGSFKHLGCEREGDWISRGEAEGGVRVELDDGTVVDRRRGRGATELSCRVAGVTSKGDRAAELLVRHVGLGEDDFCTVAYFEQKRLARLVSQAMRPGERQEIVSEWLALGPLRLAAEREGKALAALRAREEKLVASRETLARFAGGHGPTEEEVARARGEAAAAGKRVESLAAAHVDALRREAEAEAAAEDDRTRAYLREESARREKEDAAGELRVIAGVLPVVRERAREAAGAAKLAAAETTTRRRVASGKFDGMCPIATRACPAVVQINADRDANAAALAAAEKREKAAAREDERSSRELREVEARDREARERATRLASMRERLASMDEAAARRDNTGVISEASSAISERLSEARRADREVAARAGELAREREAALRVERELAGIDAELARVRAEAATSREALAVLGRHGAQRRLARDALGRVQERANERLARAEIGLSLSFEWGRETAQPAAECDACGLPFPASAKVKECACGAERGRRVEDGLWVRLSDRSGAAEDLAGFELGVAAGEWLREERGAAWGTLFADEPFGALDASHRRALAGSLGRLLSREHGGYEQALVVAHHPGLMDGLPGLVRIVSDGRSSRFEA